MNGPELPTASLLGAQAAWLGPLRARLLRQVGVARRRAILDLGAGRGAVTAELLRRGGGRVVALDRHAAALADAAPFGGAERVAGDAARLPFAAGCFDLVYAQFVWLWLADAETAVAEAWRVLRPGGVLVALEPDYGGLLEHPPAVALRAVWLAALARAGAQPRIGRLLPGLLAARGFAVRAALPEALQPPAQARFAFLAALPLTPEEETAVARAAAAAARLTGDWAQVAHLPVVGVVAVRPD